MYRSQCQILDESLENFFATPTHHELVPLLVLGGPGEAEVLAHPVEKLS